MVEIVKQLQSTTSNNEKIEILKNITNDDYKRFLLYTYSPYINSYIKKINVNYAGKKEFDDTINQFFDLYDLLNHRQITGKNAINFVENFLSECNKETQELYINSLLKDLRCGINVKMINKALNNLIDIFTCQLANKYDMNKKYSSDYFYISPKLDGIRCIYKNGQLYSREGKFIYGFDHIIKECKDLEKNFDFEFLDGELYSEDIGFQKIQSIVSSYKKINYKDKELIKYNIFLIYKNNFRNTEEMITYLNFMFGSNNFQYIKPILYIKIKNDKNEIEKYLNEFSQKYEGIMLRHEKNYWSNKRDDNLLKYKKFLEDDFIIDGFIEGEGKYENMLGALIVKGELNGKRIISEVGSGFDDELRKEIWINRDKYIKRKVEVKYQNITDEEIDGYYSLRFPVFLKMK